MAVWFERYGRLYYLDPGEANYRVGDRVLVPTDSGPEVAECVWAPEWVEEEFGALPVCAGLAGAAHLERDAVNRRRRAEVKLVAKRLIKRLDLPMKVVGGGLPSTRRSRSTSWPWSTSPLRSGWTSGCWWASWPGACEPGSTCAK